MARSGEGVTNVVCFCVALRAERWGRRGREVGPGRVRATPQASEGRHPALRAWEGTAKSCRTCRVKPLQCFFVGFAGSRSRSWAAGRAASAAARRDSCPCRRLRLPPRARARRQRRRGRLATVRTARPTVWPAVHRRFPGHSARDDGRQSRSALDRGPSHWTGRAGLRALGTAQLDTTAVCTKTRSDGESQQAR